MAKATGSLGQPNDVGSGGGRWSDQELDRLFQARLNHVPYDVIGCQLGRTAEECEAKYNGRVGNTEDWKAKRGLEQAVDIEASLAERQEVVDRARSRMNDRRLLTNNKTDAIVDMIRDVIRPFSALPAPLWKPNKESKDRSPEDAVLMLSDAHIGERHTLEETGGLAEYSRPIFSNRLRNLKMSVRDITQLHSKLYEIPRLHTCILGDMVHGMNDAGAWSAAYMDVDVIEQIAYGVSELANMLHYFTPMFPEIIVYGVSGNHGRAAHKNKEKHYVNWDYVLMTWLQSKFEGLGDRVKFVIPKAWFIKTSIRNHKFLMVHGEDTSGDLPVKGLQRLETKMASLTRDHSDYVLAGHFHKAAELTSSHGEVFVNGSFVGPDMHTLKAAQTGAKPTQKFFGVHDVRGVTWRYNLDLDSPRDE